jgi:threonine dehydratase
LIAGVGSVLRRAGIRVVGAQVAGVDSLRRALAREAAPAVAPAATLADGLRVAAPGRLPLQIASAFLDEIILVSEAEVAAAMTALVRSDRVIAEGAGAVAVAALPRIAGERRVAIVSGGNVDAGVLARILAGEDPSSAVL